jgi:hypothetical protein
MWIWVIPKLDIGPSIPAIQSLSGALIRRNKQRKASGLLIVRLTSAPTPHHTQSAIVQPCEKSLMNCPGHIIPEVGKLMAWAKLSELYLSYFNVLYFEVCHRDA